MTIFEKNNIQESIDEDLYNARNAVNTNPTDKQKIAGNYKKGHVTINGYKISIENPKGSTRSGKDKKGHVWSVTMAHDYGYFIRKTKGKDGEPIDVFIGDDLESQKIYVVDQKVHGKFDESKVMFCFDSEEKAKQGYLDCYEEGWKGFWKITPVSQETFKKWLYDGYRQKKPFFQYVEIIKSNKKDKEKEKKDKIMNKVQINEQQLRNLVAECIRESINENVDENFFDRMRGKFNAFKNGLGARMNGNTVDDEMKDKYVDEYEKSNEMSRSFNKVIKNVENALEIVGDAREKGQLNGKMTGTAADNFLDAGKKLIYPLKNTMARGKSTVSAFKNAAFNNKPQQDYVEPEETPVVNNVNEPTTEEPRTYQYRRKNPYNKVRSWAKGQRGYLGRAVAESIDNKVRMNEQQLRNLVAKCIKESLEENADENFFGKLFNGDKDDNGEKRISIDRKKPKDYFMDNDSFPVNYGLSSFGVAESLDRAINESIKNVIREQNR